MTTMTHDYTGTRNTGTGTHRYVTAVCACGWASIPYPTRTAEGYRLAKRDVLDHAAHMAQGPNRYCTNSCPHLKCEAQAIGVHCAAPHEHERELVTCPRAEQHRPRRRCAECGTTPA